ncbi:hypothetical protein MED297_14102 [Reinekea sp. MED297]|uniref:diguanylate cyclase n=2 Tax=Reinekea TaxID=230494 RepID=A4BI17_9GAMM|nr:hypothetical protein MED297_14102 [Reinekea sp. MED297] [Reinekea blandensis MED297]
MLTIPHGEAETPDQWEAIPTFDLATQPVEKRGELSGEWGFAWHQQLNPATLAEPAESKRTVQLPDYLNNLIHPEERNGRFAQGHATYFVRIKNLSDFYSRPAITMRYVSEAWAAYWLFPDGHTERLGGSGELATDPENQVIRDHIYVLDLPRESNDGILVVHLSAYHGARAGLYGLVKVEEQETLIRSILGDLTIRAVFFGIGLFVVFQNLLLYLRHRSDQSFLLLSVFAFAGIARSAFASNYVTYFVNQPWFSIPAVKIEYILILWPGIAALHYVCHLFPWRWNRLLLSTSYLILAVASIYTLLAPMVEVSYYLLVYNALLVLIVLAAVCVVIHGMLRRHEMAFFFSRSVIPLIIAMLNDIVAASTPDYNFYFAEYALILFLFIHTQRQAVQFVTALRVAEHLSNNLQREVELKTSELSLRNRELEAKHQRVKLLSQTDHLTGLYNRQSLDNRTKALFEQAEQSDSHLSLIMMDIDHFKPINDRFGHQVGDECLVHVASFLRGLNLRHKDLIARFGGEEFTIVLPDTSIEHAQHLIEDVCTRLSKETVSGSHYEIQLTASFGIAERVISQAPSYEELIQKADQALYQAKQNGRNRVEVYQSDTPE